MAALASLGGILITSNEKYFDANGKHSLESLRPSRFLALIHWSRRALLALHTLSNAAFAAVRRCHFASIPATGRKNSMKSGQISSRLRYRRRQPRH